MAADLQEDASEKMLKILIKVSRLSGDLIMWLLKQEIEKLRNREPIGKQSMKTLARGNQKLSEVSLQGDQSWRQFVKLARHYGVGYHAEKIKDGYQVFFRATRSDQLNACIEAYAQQKLKSQGQPKKSIEKNLERAAKTADSKNAEHTAERQPQVKVQKKEHSR